MCVTNALTSTHRVQLNQRGPVPDFSNCSFQQPISLQLRGLWESLGGCLHKPVWKRRPANAYLLRNWKLCELVGTRTHLLSKSAPSHANQVRSITFSSVPVYIMVGLEWTVLLNLINCFIRSTLASNFHVNPLLTIVKWCLKYSFDWVLYPSLIYHNDLLLNMERVRLNIVREMGMFPGYASVYCTLIGSLMH